MNTKARIATGAFALCLVALGAAVSGCGSEPTSPRPPADSPVKVTTIDGYELKGDPKSVVEYSGNKLIFTGEVIGQQPSRKVERDESSGDVLTYIYTPIIIRVERVLKGSPVSPGQEITVRVIGGQIGSEKTINKTGPAPDKYQPGMKLVLFTQPFVNAGDGLLATTPNFVYAEDSVGNVYNLHEPTHKTGHSLFMASIDEWVAFNS